MPILLLVPLLAGGSFGLAKGVEKGTTAAIKLIIVAVVLYVAWLKFGKGKMF